jgi:NAD(P)-dependent dehydrogenase (short-subunit alcohol dehydrogenase family)
MALELAEHGIRVNSVAPGEIASVVAFPASDAACYVTGSSTSLTEVSC